MQGSRTVLWLSSCERRVGLDCWVSRFAPALEIFTICCRTHPNVRRTYGTQQFWRSRNSPRSLDCSPSWDDPHQHKITKYVNEKGGHSRKCGWSRCKFVYKKLPPKYLPSYSSHPVRHNRSCSVHHTSLVSLLVATPPLSRHTILHSP